MQVVSNGYKNAIKTLGREIDAKIYFNVDNEEIILGAEDINSMSLHYEGDILKSVMKQLDIECKYNIPIGTEIVCEFGVKVDDDYQYITLGIFYVYSSETQNEANKEENTYRLVCYDKMLSTMKEYKHIDINYPITLRSYINRLCQELNIVFGNASDTFTNYNRTIKEELFATYDSENQKWNSLGYTYRDIFDQLAQATASTICINDANELEIRYINNTNETIDEESLKDVNINFGEIYGPINTITFKRSEGTDAISVSYPADLPDDQKNEISISDNQILNGNDRDEYIDEILERLNGLQYYLNDFVSTGITYLDLCDRYNVSIDGETYSCIMFNDEINITQGLVENIHTDRPTESITDYTKTDTTDRKINQTYLIVDKQNQTIESVISQTIDPTNPDSTTSKVAKLSQKVDELTSEISNITGMVSTKDTTSGSITFTDDTNESEPITIKVYPINDNISYLYPHNGLYPSSTTYLKNRKIRFYNNTTEEVVYDYVLPDDLLYYDAEHYDEFYLDLNSQTCQITKKCKFNADGSIGLLASETIVSYPYPQIDLTEGNYTISLLGYTQGYLLATLMAKNIYTDQFYTKVETNSIINQTAQNITLGVNQTLSNYSTTSQMNSAISVSANNITSSVSNTYATKDQVNTISGKVELKVDKDDNDQIVSMLNASADQINITSNRLVIDSSNFKLNSSGNITATGGEIGGFELTNTNFSGSSSITRNFDDTDMTRISNIWNGSITPTANDFNKYDLNGDKVINNLDMLRARKIKLGDMSATQSCDFDINSNNAVHCLRIVNTNTGDENVSLGLYGGFIKELGVETLNATSMIGLTDPETNDRKITLNADDGLIECVRLVQTSKAESKKNFEKLENALDIIKNVDIYKYNYKDEENNTKKHIGFVIGENFNYSEELTSTNNDGAEIYSLASVCLQAIKEQQKEIETLKNEIKKIKEAK